MSWATNLPATSAIDYGTTASYGASTPVDPTMVTTHQMAITNLSAATTYHYRVRSADGSSTATSSDQMFSTAGGADTTPPTVSMTSPANGASVAGMVAVMATASDNVRVASVQFQLDGVSVGAAEAASPYSYSWDSTKTPNGSHALRAVATDSAGNSTTSASVTVTVNNATTPQTFTISGTLSPAAGGSGATVTLSGASGATTDRQRLGRLHLYRVSQRKLHGHAQPHGVHFRSGLAVDHHRFGQRHQLELHRHRTASAYVFYFRHSEPSGRGGWRDRDLERHVQAPRLSQQFRCVQLHRTRERQPIRSRRATPGFTFSPASLLATIASANVTGLNFTATAQPPPPSRFPER